MRARYGYHLVVSVEFDVVAERELEASAEDEPVAVVKSSAVVGVVTLLEEELAMD
jgi:hypothetical protein